MSGRAAAAPYEGYIYDSSLKPTPSLNCYDPLGRFSGLTLGAGVFSGPSDLFVTRDGRLFVSDAGNNRILAIDIASAMVEDTAGDGEYQEGEDAGFNAGGEVAGNVGGAYAAGGGESVPGGGLSGYSVVEEITGFEREGVRDGFNKPQGIYVTPENELYVADTQNQRIVHLDAERRLVKIIAEPKSEVIAENYVFKPRKLVVDQGGRVYAVAEATLEGLIQFGDDGEFIGYFGSNRVKINPAELLLRLFLTKEQRAKRSAFVPVEYSNIFMDSHDFIYTTTVNQYNNQVKRLNFAGMNILRQTGRSQARFGDIHATLPYMSGICVDEYENVTALDGQRGRMYQYNQQGELLTIYGGQGDALGLFRSAVAVAQYGDRIFVLDSVTNEITVFAANEFGALVQTANNAFFRGEYDASAAAWSEALRRNGAYKLAYIGLGDDALRQKRYKDAMGFYRSGEYKKGYSKAYKEYRNELLRANFSVYMTAIAALCALLYFTRKKRKELVRMCKAYFYLET